MTGIQVFIYQLNQFLKRFFIQDFTLDLFYYKLLDFFFGQDSVVTGYRT